MATGGAARRTARAVARAGGSHTISTYIDTQTADHDMPLPQRSGQGAVAPPHFATLGVELPLPPPRRRHRQSTTSTSRISQFPYGLGAREPRRLPGRANGAGPRHDVWTARSPCVSRRDPRRLQLRVRSKPRRVLPQPRPAPAGAGALSGGSVFQQQRRPTWQSGHHRPARRQVTRWRASNPHPSHERRTPWTAAFGAHSPGDRRRRRRLNHDCNVAAYDIDDEYAAGLASAAPARRGDDGCRRLWRDHAGRMRSFGWAPGGGSRAAWRC